MSSFPTLHCAFLSTDGLEGYVVDDDRAYVPFREANIVVERVSWHTPDVDWNRFDIVIVRSTWDYQDAPDDFFDVLASIDASQAELANPLSILRWNVEKTYLRELEAAGAPVVPSRWGDALDAAGLDTLNAAFAGQPWVIKPVIGANAAHAFAVSKDTLDAARDGVLESFAARAWVAQPFMERIRDDGEYSVFQFGDALSHAIQKVPRSGDFRVQEEHGGDIRPVPVNDELRAISETVDNALPGGRLYSRYDVVRDANGRLCVMEIELIEPSLYLRTDSAAPARFASATRAWLETCDPNRIRGQH